MIINSITLKNFRSYEDETTFTFTPKDNKNIILIGGENGAGKSTLFEAIKLCIYGPTIYGYIGENHNYFTKIKSNINDNAYKNEKVDSFVALDLSFKEGTQLKNYSIKRSWNYDKQKINETFEVYLDSKLLNLEDKLYFDKYIKSVIPPTLFNFFFFDGEELSDFFTGKNANSNLKESVLELFNYDTFQVLKKQLLSQQRTKIKSNAKIDEARINFDNISSEVVKIKIEINELETAITSDEENLEDLNIKRDKIEKDFRNSGGLLEEEKVKVNSKITEFEIERSNLNQEIKDFCNETLPFLLVSDLLNETKTQIQKEDNINSYNSIKEKLSGNKVKAAISKHMDQFTIISDFDGIAEDLIKSMYDIETLENSKMILELSSQEKNSIIHTIDLIDNNKKDLSQKVINKFHKISEATNKIKLLRDKLNSSVSKEILNSYLDSLHSVNSEINKFENSITLKKASIEAKHDELKNKEYHLTRARNEYSTLLQDQKVLEMSSQLIEYLDELLNNLTKDKISLIEQEFIEIFSTIIRKENYVNSIEIDDKFNTTLYVKKDYTSGEILNIIKNLGYEGLIKKHGTKFLEDLLKYYKLESTDELEKIVSSDIGLHYISLNTKISINDFSNGEKQIYILCLIWAIIKSSGVEIPFIIDTPYARIDETHRNSLTTDYLPNISKQVIILSTNKEIDGNLYNVIKPYLCNEYLLLYNTSLRKTEVKNGYFEV